MKGCESMTFEDIKKEVQKPAYDFLRNDPKLGGNIILLGLGGSHAYGTNVEDSDIDIRGIALNSKQETLLQRDYEQVVERETDTVIYSLTKIVELLSDDNPNTLEILFLRPDQYLYLSPLGQELVDKRHMFLYKRAYYSFGGYARQQLRRLDNKTMRSLSQSQQEAHILNSIINASYTFHEKYFPFTDDEIKLYVDTAVNKDFETEIFMDINLKHYPLRDYKSMWMEMHNIVKDYNKLGKRASNAILHNKVNKHAMHLVRLMLACIDLMRTGTFCTHCEKYLPLLMDIRNGKYMGEDGQMKPEFFQLVKELEHEMDDAFEHTCLPDKPDYAAIDAFMMDAREKIILGIAK